MAQIKLTFLQKIGLMIKMVAGSAVSWELAILFGSKHPYLAPISLILCLQATIVKSIRFSFARIGGTIIGVGAVVLLASKLHANGWTIALIMLISLVFPLILGANSSTLHQIALSVLLVFVFEHKLHGYGVDRIRDTIVGVAVALLLHIFFMPPNFTSRAVAEVEDLPNLLVEKLRAMAVWLEAGTPKHQHYEQDMNRIQKQMFEAEQQIKKADLSLLFNPLSQKSNIDLNIGKTKLKAMKGVSMHMDAMYNIITEWAKEGSLSKKNIGIWVENLLCLADVLRNWQEGKAIMDIQLINNFEEEKFSPLVLWHANQFISIVQNA